jgi:hypothetical protein
MKFSVPSVGRPSVGLPRFALRLPNRPSLPGRPDFHFSRAGAVAATRRLRPGAPSRAGAVAAARRLRPGSVFERVAWIPAGVLIAVVVVLVSVYSGSVHSTDSTLVLMGFDPDRAQLITALVMGAVAAGAVTLLVNRIGFSAMLGTFALAALFTETFVTETQAARASTGTTGSFDLEGWVLTLATLIAIGLISSWAGATLAAAVRPGIISTGVAVRDMVKVRRPSFALARRPVAALLVLVLLAVTVPAFGDMVNLSPDALMLQGNQGGGGLVPNFSVPPMAFDTPSATPAASVESTGPSSGATPSGSAKATPTGTPRITAKPGTKPWLAWKPSGAGRVTTVNLPAPWIGGDKNTSEVDVYTPPGYDPKGDRLYPVVYEAPTGLPLWGGGTGVIGSLDQLITSGTIPATIVVFVDSLGPPYADTECADMPDYRQWFETYISTTVVFWTDAHFKTIRDQRARAIMGMSAGGFCSAMLALRHPDVFSISIAFSGYYSAGSGGPNSVVPFGEQANLDAHSPVWLAPRIPTADRSKLYFIVVAAPLADFYGSWAVTFEQVLKGNGYKYLKVDSAYTHGWPQVRYEEPGALEAWGAQLVVNGLW